MAGALGLSLVPGEARADAEELCATGSADWSVIADASSAAAASAGFMCNYRVPRDKVRLDDGSERDLGPSGVAITIEYHCTADAARARYTSVAGPRDSESFRDDAAGILIIEEGPTANNKGTRQREGVYSGFFRDGRGEPLRFGLMEKEWRLLNPHVFATIVVLTNERGAVEETERFGVAQAEVVARTLAERSRATAGCPIPAVDAASGTTSPAPIVLGTIGLILIGGYTVWRRRKGKTPPAPRAKAAPKVPSPCRGLATIYDDHVSTLTTLREAVTDLGERLERAERIHTNNIIKAKMVVNLEIISAIGGTATDLAVALRPAVLRRAGPSALGQQDTWKPPGDLGGRFADAIRRAQAAATTAIGKLRGLADDVAELAASVERRVSELPIVKNARQLVDYHKNMLSEMVADLPAANRLRKELGELEHAGQVTSVQNAGMRGFMRTLEGRIAELETKLNLSRNAADPHGFALRDLKAAEDALAELQTSGVEDTLRLSQAAERVDALRANVAFQASSKDVKRALEDLPKLERALAQEMQNLEGLRAQHELIAARDVALTKRRNAVTIELRNLREVTQPDVDMQKRVVGQAEQELHDALAGARRQLEGGVSEKQAQLHRAEVEAASAQGLLDDLRGQAEQATIDAQRGADLTPQQGGVVSAIGRAIAWATAPIRYPLTIAGEIVFGVGQSPQEIMEILLQGRANVQLLRSHLGAVKRATFHHERKVQTVRRQLDDCVAGKGLKRVDVPAEGAARAA